MAAPASVTSCDAYTDLIARNDSSLVKTECTHTDLIFDDSIVQSR